jgi:hypothetical protein
METVGSETTHLPTFGGLTLCQWNLFPQLNRVICAQVGGIDVAQAVLPSWFMSSTRIVSLASVLRIFGGCALLSLAASTGACALDGVDGGDPPVGDGPFRIPSDDPSDDDRLDTLQIICESTLSVTGTFVAGLPEQPDDMNGCWPVGTWTVSATVDRLGCDPQPEIETFVYEVTFDEENSTHNVGFPADPTNERVNLKISTSGDSLCHGSMDHYDVDGTVWGFRPTLQLDGSLEGTGTYTVHQEDSF